MGEGQGNVEWKQSRPAPGAQIEWIVSTRALFAL